MWAGLVFWGTAALVGVSALSTLVHQRWARRLPDLDTLPARLPPASPVSCSVVVPARDEEERVAATVRHLLAQKGVAVDVIVVDDRSADRTWDILQRLAAGDPRVRALRIDRLPDGWLGKSHACHAGASAARGEWILFTDADCWLRSDVVARALGLAEQAGADHVTLTPAPAGGTLAARAWHLAFLASLANWISGVNRDRPGAYVGMGAFNLVRAAAYRESGGYSRLRMTVLDDVKLGLLLRRAGRRTRAFVGGPDVQCAWATTVPDGFRVMEKNYFAAVEFKLLPVIAVAVLVPLLLGAVLVGPWTGSAAGVAAGLSPLLLILPAAVFARRLGWPVRCALLAPLLYPVMMSAFLYSAFATLRRGGISWRGTFYPLDALRAGRVR